MRRPLSFFPILLYPIQPLGSKALFRRAPAAMYCGTGACIPGRLQFLSAFFSMRDTSRRGYCNQRSIKKAPPAGRSGKWMMSSLCSVSSTRNEAYQKLPVVTSLIQTLNHLVLPPASGLSRRSSSVHTPLQCAALLAGLPVAAVQNPPRPAGHGACYSKYIWVQDGGQAAHLGPQGPASRRGIFPSISLCYGRPPAAGSRAAGSRPRRPSPQLWRTTARVTVCSLNGVGCSPLSL